MSKIVLIILGVIILAMGVLGLFAIWDQVNDPAWRALIKIVIGLFAIYVGATDKA